MVNERVTLELDLYFYPFFFILCLVMWLSVVAIFVFIIKAVSETNSNLKDI